MNDNLPLLMSRHSVRTYTTEEIPNYLKNRLRAEISMINSHEYGMKFQLFFNDNNPFNSFKKSYGVFKNANNYMAAVVDIFTKNSLERAGYFAEKFVIRAVESGLGTCFVGGTFDANSVNAQIRAGEKILFLVIFGFENEKKRRIEKFSEKIIHRKIMKPEDFFIPRSQFQKAISRFPELFQGLQGVACAPSSLNKRPVRIKIEEYGDEKKLCAFVDDSNKKNLIDLGIAKFNFNFSTNTQCDWGNGAPLITNSFE